MFSIPNTLNHFAKAASCTSSVSNSKGSNSISASGHSCSASGSCNSGPVSEGCGSDESGTLAAIGGKSTCTSGASASSTTFGNGDQHSSNGAVSCSSHSP
jgi:hypothetical protein